MSLMSDKPGRLTIVPDELEASIVLEDVFETRPQLFSKVRLILSRDPISVEGAVSLIDQEKAPVELNGLSVPAHVYYCLVDSARGSVVLGRVQAHNHTYLGLLQRWAASSLSHPVAEEDKPIATAPKEASPVDRNEEAESEKTIAHDDIGYKTRDDMPEIRRDQTLERAIIERKCNIELQYPVRTDEELELLEWLVAREQYHKKTPRLDVFIQRTVQRLIEWFERPFLASGVLGMVAASDGAAEEFRQHGMRWVNKLSIAIPQDGGITLTVTPISIDVGDEVLIRAHHNGADYEAHICNYGEEELLTKESWLSYLRLALSEPGLGRDLDRDHTNAETRRMFKWRQKTR